MESRTKFSVVIPLYNKEKYVRRAVNSVLLQRYRDFELIVVDDGSTDNSIETLAEVRDSLTIVKQDNSGESAARNAGVRHAGNPYIAFLDADDEWHPEFLESIVTLIRMFPHCRVYCTNYIKRLHGVDSIAVQTPDPRPRQIDYFEIARHGSNPSSSSSTCVRASVFESLGGFPVGVKLYPDLYFWTKVALEYDFAFDPTPRATYHRDAESRVCNEVAPKSSDVAFSELIEKAALDHKLDATRLAFARQFISHYQLLNAFKALAQFGSRDVRSMLSNCRPDKPSQRCKMYLIIAASYFPRLLVHSAWKLGKGILRH